MNKIVLCGNPNVGKSTIFNSITKSKQHTGNWTGKTVDIAFGKYKYKNEEYLMYDLPGTYSLLSKSKEEQIARDFLCFNESDLIVIVCDATCLERNLSLVLQVLEITNNVLVCINLMDEAKREKIDIDISKLKEKLNVEVIGITSKNKNDIEYLKEKIEEQIKIDKIDDIDKNYPLLIEDSVLKLSDLFKCDIDERFKRWLSLKLLDNDFILIENIIDKYNLNRNEYLKIKDELIEDGYDTSRVSDTYAICTSTYSSYIAKEVVKEKSKNKISFFDKIMTNKFTGIPIMITFMIFILWITIVASNVPSEILFNFFKKGEIFLNNINVPSILVNGVYKIVTWIISVMLPPMLIFFPLFTLLENIGFLPRIAFNLDKCFNKCKTCGKQSLTMLMGFGCNVVGVNGCRIIDSKRERIIAIITNSFIPCNGRFPSIITIITIFFVCTSFQISLYLLLFILLSVIITFIICKILTSTLLKGESTSFILELPPYRKPKILKTLIDSFVNKTLSVLIKAIKIAIPSSILIWLLANIKIDGNSLLFIFSSLLNPLGNLFGLDGAILLAFLLGLPANEIIIPILLMIYTKNSTLVDFDSIKDLKNLLIQNGWTIKTAICFIVMMIFHFPCINTILTIKEETKSNKWTLISLFIPLLIGLILCILINLI